MPLPRMTNPEVLACQSVERDDHHPYYLLNVHGHNTKGSKFHKELQKYLSRVSAPDWHKLSEGRCMYLGHFADEDAADTYRSVYLPCWWHRLFLHEPSTVQGGSDSGIECNSAKLRLYSHTLQSCYLFTSRPCSYEGLGAAAKLWLRQRVVRYVVNHLEAREASLMPLAGGELLSAL